jgi:hypothetical protein
MASASTSGVTADANGQQTTAENEQLLPEFT